MKLHLLVVAFLVSCTDVNALPINPNPFFDSGLTSWGNEGSVSVSGGVARLDDQDPNGLAALYQIIDAGPGEFVFSFDLFASIAEPDLPPVGGNVFSDVSFGTLYFSDDPDIASNLPSLQFSELFNADSTGVTSSLTQTPLGNGWTRFSTTFTTTARYLAPIFELLDLDFIPNNFIELDNVTLERVPAQPVPEPATGVLALLGAAPLLRLRKRKA